MDSTPRSPSPELDDHRNQSPIRPVDPDAVLRRTSISPAPPAEGQIKRGTTSSVRKPTLLFVPSQLEGPVGRDFGEAAVTDDEGDDTGKGAYSGRSPRRHRSRRLTREGGLSVDQDYAISSRSVSPPNSVDAFAEPRRRERANTFGSIAPSERVERTVSGGTHRRRPTITNNGSIREFPIDDDTPAEEDVCFPQDVQPDKQVLVDFEAIEEFVAECRRGRLNRTRHRNLSISGHHAANKPHAPAPPVLQITRAGSKPHEWKGSDSDTPNTSAADLNEKLDEADHVRRGSVAEDQRFSFFSSEIEQTIHVSDFGDLIMPGESFRDLFELPEEDGAWWLDILDPTEDEIDMFQKAFGIHRLTAEDIEKNETREKVELFKQYYFVSFRSFEMDPTQENYLDPVMIYMVVFRQGILTFSYAQAPHAAHVRGRISKLRNYINLTADWICYAMVDDIIDCFAPPIVQIERESDQIEDQVFTLRAEDSLPLLRNIGDCRKKVTSMMRLLGGKADVIKGFAKRCNEQYSMTPRHEIGLYLGDIQDHVVTMVSNLNAYDNMLSRSHANYLAHLSVEHMTQGNKANEVLSKITIVATILVPMNLITGLFGMNVHIPGQDGDNLGWFFGIVGVIVGFVLVGLCIAKKAKFI